ncbi:DNA phosphorothioation system sulfurtransferase DndC [Halorarum salinum]|uniref:DNA phosphorothioation system sulfurtransferase DndC n=1 Tax=Halorarum salinum TaxID=2743089 RepID=A0A7D5LAS2_9EURY|nr:DNA phosphorothioation system sulfurtransferase DndC [Halobaculum salinum]QLG62014.1 DNA phosphorothioation system sulfurtransferase DndC [Halobaculum salinum]
MSTEKVEVSESEQEKGTSVFDDNSLSDIHKEIQDTYLADNRPWVIGYSGGKDSTTALQLIWYAIKELPEEERTKPVYVISSDTLVETPKIVNHIITTLENVNEFSEKDDLPFQAHKVTPQVDDSFWVNLIGRGYPAPNQTFRWCTERLKIDPADRFIEETVSEHGEVVVVLGARKAESATRKQVMELHEIEGSVLSRHSKFANAFVYTPIEDWLVDDVWSYLLQVDCPWGKNNRDLAALYQEADDECPMVIDTKTPSCGNSRFGCWTCTVVSEDKAMQNMIDEGDDWMEPLLEFRDFLKGTQDPDRKPHYRQVKGRQHGSVRTKTNGDDGIIPRAHKFEFCKDLLEKLLQTQKEVNEQLPADEEMDLIQDEELREIRRLWREERADWADSVPKIYERVMGEELNWVHDDLGSFGETEAAVLKEVCEDQDLPPELIQRLLDTELQHHGMKRRASIYNEIDKVMKEDWRIQDEIVAEIEGEENVEKWHYTETDRPDL